MIGERLSLWSQRTPSAPALIDFDGAALSYRELEKTTGGLAAAWAAAGIAPFELFGVHLMHSLEAAAVNLSLMRAGITGLTLDRKATAAETRETSADLPLRAVLTDRAGRGFFSARPAAEHPVKLRGRDYVLLVFGTPAPMELAAGDVRWTLLTSGSTGRRKAVMISGRSLLERTLGEIEAFRLETGDRLLNLLTFGHDLGLNQLLTSVYHGAALRMAVLISGAELIRRLEAEPFAGLTGTPTIWRYFAQALEAGIAAPRCTPRYLTVSGGRLESAALRRLYDAFPATRILRTYGQTEAFRAFATDAREGLDLGRPIPGVSLRIEDGQLVHEGAGTMAGYLGDPVLTAAKMRGGAVFTGDDFSVDARGGYTFLGRRDEMVKRRDHRVYLGEIERALSGGAAGLGEVAVVHREGTLTAFAARSSDGFSEKDFFLAAGDLLTSYKIPDRVIFLGSLPRTESGKVDKPKLLALMESGDGPVDR